MAKKILITDDNAMNLKMAEMILKQKQYDILTADSGPKCIELLKNESVDLILMDIEMPGMDGFETMEQIRKDSVLSLIPSAFLTASDDDETIERAKSLGVSDYIKKPFTPADLQSRVAGLIGE